MCKAQPHIVIFLGIHRKETSANKLLFNPAEEGRRITND